MRAGHTTSLHIGDGLFNRRAESDTDSGICVGMDIAEAEKQFLPVSRPGTPVKDWTLPSHHAPTSTSKFKQAILFLLPSFLGQKLQRMPMIIRSTHEVPALDGLRGIASFIVFNVHFSFDFDRTFLLGYGVNLQKTIIQWPIVRIFWSGLSMVSILFVISGYALSFKALRSIHNGNLADAHRTISSSAMRRGFRLYFPTIIAVMLSGLLSWAGAFERSRAVHTSPDYNWNLHEALPPRFESIVDQFQDVFQHSSNLFNIWTASDGSSHAGDYDLHTWLIPVEFRNSMLLFLILLSVSRLRTIYRLSAQFAVLLFTISTSNKNMALFQAGMLLAEFDFIRKSKSRFVSFSNSSSLRESFFLKSVSPHSLLYPLLFILGLYVSSIPVYGAEYDPFYKKIVALIPEDISNRAEWLRVPGAIMIVWAAANSAYLRPVFTNPIATYLGKISFALYLVHGNIIRLVLHPMFPWVYGLISNGTKEGQTTSQLLSAWALSAALVIPLAIWVADIFWRSVDLPCIRFAKWAESKMCDMEEEDQTPSSSPKRSELEAALLRRPSRLV